MSFIKPYSQISDIVWYLAVPGSHNVKYELEINKKQGSFQNFLMLIWCHKLILKDVNKMLIYWYFWRITINVSMIINDVIFIMIAKSKLSALGH